MIHTNQYACPGCRVTVRSIPWEPGEVCEHCVADREFGDAQDAQRTEAVDDALADATPPECDEDAE